MSLERNIQKTFMNKLNKLGFARKVEATNHAGMPDILFLCKSKVYFLEIKTDTGVVSKIQQYTIDQINAEGGDARVLTGAIEIDRFLIEITWRIK